MTGPEVGGARRLCSAPLYSFHAHGDAHAAADAERREAFLGTSAAHLVDQRVEDAGA